MGITSFVLISEEDPIRPVQAQQVFCTVFVPPIRHLSLFYSFGLLENQ
jgi:hypothetical protein